MVTDDARIVDPRSCQLESWLRRNRNSTEFWALPGCNFTGNLEVTFGGARTDDGRSRETSDVVLQAKTLFKSLDPGGWSIGAVAGAVRHPPQRTDRRLGDDLYAYVPASFSLNQDRVIVHGNAGLLNARQVGELRMTWGLGTEAQRPARYRVHSRESRVLASQVQRVAQQTSGTRNSTAMRLAILDDYMNLALASADWEGVRRRGVEITVFDTAFASAQVAAAELAPFEIVNLLRERTHFTRALIERLPNLKLIAMTGRRAPSLDIAAATERRILISNTHGGEGGASTAELAWSLLMAAARDLANADRGMRAGRWHAGVRAGLVLEERRLGVIGLGRLGSRVAGYGRAFGMDVVAWSQNLTAERAAECGARYVSKDELFATADFISVHIVLSERTRGLIGAADFARMKPNAIFVNSSRGPIVNESDLIDALKRRRFAHAALDVYSREPLPAEHPLRSMDNVTLAPHLGYVNTDIFKHFYGESVKNIEAWLDGKPINVLNPDALK
jgi:phosphoglycerate dehydrogenase-like enzyme